MQRKNYSVYSSAESIPTELLRYIAISSVFFSKEDFEP